MCLEPQFPEMDNAPNIWLGWAAPALGRQPSYTPVPKRWHTSSNHAGVTCPPCLPDARQEKQTAPTGTPLRPQITVSRATFQGAKSIDKEKSVFKNVIQITRIKQALSKPHRPLEPGLSLDPGEQGPLPFPPSRGQSEAKVSLCSPPASH